MKLVKMLLLCGVLLLCISPIIQIKRTNSFQGTMLSCRQPNTHELKTPSSRQNPTLRQLQEAVHAIGAQQFQYGILSIKANYSDGTIGVEVHEHKEQLAWFLSQYIDLSHVTITVPTNLEIVLSI